MRESLHAGVCRSMEWFTTESSQGTNLLLKLKEYWVNK